MVSPALIPEPGWEVLYACVATKLFTGKHHLWKCILIFLFSLLFSPISAKASLEGSTRFHLLQEPVGITKALTVKNWYHMDSKQENFRPHLDATDMDNEMAAAEYIDDIYTF